jgi:hypothetical protein
MNRCGIAAVAAVSMIFSSCDESFSPKVEVDPRPVLHCIIDVTPRAEQYTVDVGLSHVYDAPGFIPPAQSPRPAIRGASVVLWVNQKRHSMPEQMPEQWIRPREALLFKGTPGVYRATGVRIRTMDSISVTAHLPDRTILTARTRIPKFKPPNTWPRYSRGITTQLDEFYFGNAFIINWTSDTPEEHIFFPSLVLSYTKTVDSTERYLSKEIPLRFARQGSETVPIYPGYTTETELVYQFDAIDGTMEAISAGDPVKERYRILAISFSMRELDFSLSRYYASIHGALDQFSIRVDETTFSNVSNGIGILGTSMETTHAFEVERHYVESFGYRALSSGGASLGSDEAPEAGAAGPAQKAGRPE